jgi:hypothetical protein
MMASLSPLNALCLVANLYPEYIPSTLRIRCKEPCIQDGSDMLHNSSGWQILLSLLPWNLEPAQGITACEL